MSHRLHSAPVASIAPELLYALLKLRVDVFVVEQECAYPELDGRDLEPGAVQHWATSESGEVVATLRVLRDANGDVRIGRVATAASARGAGLAAQLMTAAMTAATTAGPEAAPDSTDLVLDAQAHLAGWYARFGFVVDGAEYVEDGIPHVPMRKRT